MGHERVTYQLQNKKYGLFFKLEDGKPELVGVPLAEHAYQFSTLKEAKSWKRKLWRHVPKFGDEETQRIQKDMWKACNWNIEMNKEK